jgi:predicted nucleic acid-binding protein
MNVDSPFLDTNVLVYAYSNILDKKLRSLELLNYSHCITSTQVLSELSNVCFNKLHYSDNVINGIVKEVMIFCDIAIVEEMTILHAISIKGRYGYSYYDSLILASALESECSVLYSEDLQHGQVIEGSLKIVNPFSAATSV